MAKKIHTTVAANVVVVAILRYYLRLGFTFFVAFLHKMNKEFLDNHSQN